MDGKNESVRDPLVVSTSVDGLAFSSSVAVMSCHAPGFQCGARIAGLNKNNGGAGPSYPQAVTVTAPKHIAGLFVVATVSMVTRKCRSLSGYLLLTDDDALQMNKEDVVVVRVPFSSLGLERSSLRR